jgi:hypothetical protein
MDYCGKKTAGRGAYESMKGEARDIDAVPLVASQVQNTVILAESAKEEEQFCVRAVLVLGARLTLAPPSPQAAP